MYILQVYPFGGKLLKPGKLYFGPTNQPTKDKQLTTEELKYSRNRARGHRHPTNNLLEVWQNLAPFGVTPISIAIEVLLTKVLNW
jgi:hypothetical protein